jgi:type IV pilus assembly protein PilM
MKLLPYGKKNRVYIDLGSCSIKILTVSPDGKVTCDSVQTPENVIRGTFSNIEIDFKTLGDLLCKTLKGKKSDLILLCPDQFTKLIYMTIPRDMTIESDRKFMYFRIKKNLDQSIQKDVFIDYVVHEMEKETEDEEETSTPDPLNHLNVLIGKNELLESFQDLFRGTAISLSGISSTSSGIINSVLAQDKKNFALINMGYEVTTVSIVSRGILLYQRVIETAGRHLISQIMSETDTTEELARSHLEENLILPNLKTDFEKSLREYPLSRKLFSPLLNEISMTFKFFHESFHHMAFDSLVLTGGLAGIPGIDEFMTAVFDIPAEKFSAKSDHVQFDHENASLADFLNGKE